MREESVTIVLTSIVVLFQDTEYYDVHRLSSPSLLAQLQMFHHYMPSRDGWKEKERERERGYTMDIHV